MDWDEIKGFIEQNIIQRMQSPAGDLTWLESLDDERCEDGQLLAISILIDVASGAVDPDVYVSVLDLVDPSASDARAEFSKALERFPDPDRLRCCSRHELEPLREEESYARVQPLAVFITRYLSTSFAYYDLSGTDAEEVRRVFFDDPGGLSLGQIRACWSGRGQIVWVMSSEELSPYPPAPGGGQPASTLVDRLGLPNRIAADSAGKSEFVAVVYPPQLKVRCAQPTALDAHWSSPGGYYISWFKQDAWGRTNSCSGSQPRLRERVHHGTFRLTDEFRAHYISSSSQPIENRDRLMAEAYYRADKA